MIVVRVNEVSGLQLRVCGVDGMTLDCRVQRGEGKVEPLVPVLPV